MKNKTSTHNFGKRLATLRKEKGFTQEELSTRIGVSRRVIAYYEAETKYPPAHLLIPIAKTLKISLDELLGVKKADLTDSDHASLWRKLKKAEDLSPIEQKTLLQVLQSLLKSSKHKKQ